MRYGRGGKKWNRVRVIIIMDGIERERGRGIERIHTF